jgi:hypothetical protein
MSDKECRGASCPCNPFLTATFFTSGTPFTGFLRTESVLVGEREENLPSRLGLLSIKPIKPMQQQFYVSQEL